ncbi:MAG: class I SAM-dependent RNA methyltransferase [candidate division SR1 bacterium]|nr:class I SAM-dependent RNA methyltransferase [candidate division SR1 bacterium]
MAKILSRIKIDKIGYGGVGLARMSDGKRILIKGGALPGSIVDLRIVKQKKDYVEAHITRIQELDPKIVDGKVFCPHFFSLLSSNDENKQPRKIGCGGCKWQMLSYKNQMQLKEDIVNDAFTKIKRKLPELTILSMIGSPSEKNYRNKIEFSFGKYITKGGGTRDEEQGTRNKENKTSTNIESPSPKSQVPGSNLVLSDWSVGFHKQGEFSKIIDIDSCGLISDGANEIFDHIKELCRTSELPVHDQMTHQGFFRHLVIREGTNTKQFLVNLSVSDHDLKERKVQQRKDLLEIFKNDTLLKEKVTSFVITYNNSLADVVRSQDCKTETLRGDGFIYEKLIFGEGQKAADEAVSFRVSPFSFFQTNTLGAQQLFGQAMKMVGHIEGMILDLYCGTGTIGISFLKTGKGSKLVGIEIVEEAIQDAWYNAKINGLESKVVFLANPAEKAFTKTPEIKDKLNNLGLVIIDPPRDGLHKNVVQMICDLKKESDFKLLYISCNPVTMVRDIELLIEGGFSIKEIQPVDMFPQTHHIECIGVLT